MSKKLNKLKRRLEIEKQRAKRRFDQLGIVRLTIIMPDGRVSSYPKVYIKKVETRFLETEVEAVLLPDTRFIGIDLIRFSVENNS